MDAAHAAGRTKNTYLGALYRRMVGRKRKKRAAVAVAVDDVIVEQAGEVGALGAGGSG
jgi:hypothetical protein